MGYDVQNPLHVLRDAKLTYFLNKYSSLDKYFGLKRTEIVYVVTDASLITLAKLFDGIRYPGLPFEDAEILLDNRRFTFQCVDHIVQPPSEPYTVLELLYNSEDGIFLDPRGVYRDLRRESLVLDSDSIPQWIFLVEAAKLVSRYHYTLEGFEFLTADCLRRFPQERDRERELLSAVLTGEHPEKGFMLLYDSNFLHAFWPELSKMAEVSHIKDYHPEGNVWEHTLETLKYRKRYGLLLSLALLLHDIGKPFSSRSGDRQFNGHAEVGAAVAARFLRRLGYSSHIIQEVQFLVKFHMIPQALNKLPLYRVEKLFNSPLFPLLLEVYRADLSASYHDLDGYYEACKIYRRYLKKTANPYHAVISEYSHR